MWNFIDDFRDPSVGGTSIVTLPEYFKDHGYSTSGSGKVFHPGKPQNNDQSKSWTTPYAGAGPGNCKSFTGGHPSWYVCDSDDAPADGAVVNVTLARLGELANANATAAHGKPFFVAAGLHKPHLPYFGLPRFAALYPNVATIAIPPATTLRIPAGMPPVAWMACSNELDPPPPLFLWPWLSCRGRRLWSRWLRFRKTASPPFTYVHLLFTYPHAHRFAHALARYVVLSCCCAVGIHGEEPNFVDFNDRNITQNNPVPEALVRQITRGYMISASYVDSLVGAILDAIDANGLADDTVVAVWGDHGPFTSTLLATATPCVLRPMSPRRAVLWCTHLGACLCRLMIDAFGPVLCRFPSQTTSQGQNLGEHNTYCKMTLFESATKVPLLIRDPGSRATSWGKRTASPAQLLDMYPTLVPLAGLPPVGPAEVDGVDLTPLFRTPGAVGVSEGAYTQQARCYAKDAATPNPTPEQRQLFMMMTCEFVPRSEMDFMGYSVRTEQWRFTEWVRWNGSALRPSWSDNHGKELYDHRISPSQPATLHPEWRENENLAADPTFAPIVAQLSAQLRNHFDPLRAAVAPDPTAAAEGEGGEAPSLAANTCQCDAGSYWCSSDDTLRHNYNCSSNKPAVAAWMTINKDDTDDDSNRHCNLLKACEPQPAKSATPNATCSAECYDYCWLTDTGDCADWDDDQTFCVTMCQAWCVHTRCEAAPSPWSDCEEVCADRHMVGLDPSSGDYAFCMAKCPAVPPVGPDPPLVTSNLRA